VTRDVFTDLVEVFGYVGNEIVRRRMFALDLLENFDWRFVWVDFLCRLGKLLLFCF
jgi:hypothetical protein